MGRLAGASPLNRRVRLKGQGLFLKGFAFSPEVPKIPSFPAARI
jgi:hypothetical protein